MAENYKVIVVGAGHAGCEAALAAARMGCHTLLMTLNLDAVAQMSCNPAIGGLAKGHLVREIDALGGEMARNIDATGIQFRVLNTKKGPAVRASRAQADRDLYRARMKRVIECQSGLDLKQGQVVSLVVEGNRVVGVETRDGLRFLAPTVILTTGTFMCGLIHVGLSHYPGGRAGEPPSEGLSDQLRTLGFSVGRLKTGTPPRLAAATIDFSELEEQPGDLTPKPFSADTQSIDRPQVPCHITYTNERTHEVIRGGLDRSPLYSGVIEGVGPRYCPSIEDKVVRFPEKDHHQIFLEPEGLTSGEVYPNGVSTSLPVDVQLAYLRTMKGLEHVEIMRPGYAIEYDYVDPIQLNPSLETKLLRGLYHAGQINGTSGYEEAGAQGLMAGINAACRVKGLPDFVLKRSEAYIGVLIDDLITLGTLEPYRMFTSRAEYRLLLREDNADARLREKGYRLGLVGAAAFERLQVKLAAVENELERLRSVKVAPQPDIQQWLTDCGSTPLRQSCRLFELLKRPEIDYVALERAGLSDAALDPEVSHQAEICAKYEGYIQRQQQMIEKFRHLEACAIPPDIGYDGIAGLSTEVKDKLNSVRPVSLGQASRIAGITPVALSILMIYLKKKAVA